MSETYVAIDLEMTGLKVKEDRIIEIGAVRVDEGVVTGTFSTLVNPRCQIDDIVSGLTGITQADVDRAKTIEELLPELLAFLGERDLLGHRISFDYAFLKRAMVNQGYPFERKGIDTLELARKYLKDLPSRKLEELCVYYGIRIRAHRALEDARAAHEIYQCLKRDFPDIVQIRPKQLIYKIKKEATASKHQKRRLQELLLRHGLQPEKEIDSMTKNEISRLTDKILAKYGR